jgi:putative flippase GtrA
VTSAAPRYLLVGTTCAVLHNVVMIGGDFLRLHYVACSLASYVIVVLWGYGLHATFTFGQHMSWRSLIRYAAGMATNLPGSIALMFVFCDIAGFPVVAAAPMTTAILLLWNFATSYWAIAGRPALPKAG